MHNKRSKRILSILLIAVIAFSIAAATPIMAGASSNTMAPILSNGRAERTSATEATVRFESDIGGMYYYQVGGTVASASSLIGVFDRANMFYGQNTIYVDGLSSAAQTVYVAAADTAGNISNLLTINVPAYGTNASVSPATASFSKADAKDITVTLDRNAYTLQSVRNGAYTLVAGTDYTVSGTSYTIKASYLSTLAVSSQTITFYMSGGTNPTLVVTVTETTAGNASISPVSAAFNKSDARDIAVTLNRGNYTLSSIRYGSYTLVAGTNYTVSGNVYTLKASYLNTLAVGNQTITFYMSGGTNPALTITVSQATSITPAAATFDKNNAADIAVNLNRGTYTLQSIRNGAYILTAGVDYTMNGNTYTIKASYLNTLAAGSNQAIVFYMSGGTNPVLTVTVTASVAQGKIFPFTDVAANVWYFNDIRIAWETGLIDGRTPTAFAPNSNLTYAEAVKLAACMRELYVTGKVTLVNGSPWYQTYVDYAKANGIISKDYDWNASATRAGYMEIFANALPAASFTIINYVPDGAIPDVPMTHPQAAAIYKLYRAGILQGVDTAHNCSPEANIKRSEVAAILTRMMYIDERIGFTI